MVLDLNGVLIYWGEYVVGRKRSVELKLALLFSWIGFLSKQCSPFGVASLTKIFFKLLMLFFLGYFLEAKGCAGF